MHSPGIMSGSYFGAGSSGGSTVYSTAAAPSPVSALTETKERNKAPIEIKPSVVLLGFGSSFSSISSLISFRNRLLFIF